MPRYHRISVDGTLAQGAERWSVSFCLDASGDVAPSPGEMSVIAQDVMGLYRTASTWQGVLLGSISASGSIERVRAYSYADVGQPADSQGVSTQAAQAGSGTATMPPQCSAVVTLNTGLPGRSRRGRIYWPLCGGAIAVTQRSSYVTQTYADAFASMFSAIQGLTSVSGATLVVVSEKLGQFTEVNTISVDNIVDTQRRRRDKLVGTRYTAAPIP